MKILQSKVNMPNGYSSMASRDHKPKLHTFKCHPVHEDIAEGYEVMRAQARQAASVVSPVKLF